MVKAAEASLPAPPAIDRRQRLADLVTACKAAGLPVTRQRKAVLDAVLALDSHPTADEVHAHLAASGQAISRATVFRTLESLVELGLVAKTCHPGRGIRYDRVASQHHHLVCLRCNRMVDFVDEQLDALPLPDTEKLGFHITDVRVQVRGLCATCAAEAAETTAHQGQGMKERP